jgi:hypothetical protein
MQILIWETFFKVLVTSNDMDFPYHVQLGKHATIDINETKICNPNLPKFDLSLNMSYTVDGSKCFLEFEKSSKIVKFKW